MEEQKDLPWFLEDKANVGFTVLDYDFNGHHYQVRTLATRKGKEEKFVLVIRADWEHIIISRDHTAHNVGSSWEELNNYNAMMIEASSFIVRKIYENEFLTMELEVESISPLYNDLYRGTGLEVHLSQTKYPKLGYKVWISLSGDRDGQMLIFLENPEIRYSKGVEEAEARHITYLLAIWLKDEGNATLLEKLVNNDIELSFDTKKVYDFIQATLNDLIVELIEGIEGLEAGVVAQEEELKAIRQELEAKFEKLNEEQEEKAEKLGAERKAKSKQKNKLQLLVIVLLSMVSVILVVGLFFTLNPIIVLIGWIAFSLLLIVGFALYWIQ